MIHTYWRQSYSDKSKGWIQGARPFPLPHQAIKAQRSPRRIGRDLMTVMRIKSASLPDRP